MSAQQPQIAQPQVQQYAQPQMVQQPAPRQLQADPMRMQYNQLVEQRFNELVNGFGGIENVMRVNRLKQFRDAAAQDVEMVFGKVPEPQQPAEELQTFEINGKKYARGGIFGSQVTEVTPAAPAEEKPSEAASQIVKGSTSYISNVRPSLGNLQDAIAQIENPKTSYDQRLATARTLGKLINTIQVGSPDAVGADEARVLMSELDERIFNPRGIFTTQEVFGTNLPLFVAKLKDLSNRVANRYNKEVELVNSFDPKLKEKLEPFPFYGTGSQQVQQGQQVIQQEQSGQPSVKRRSFIPGKGFVD